MRRSRERPRRGGHKRRYRDGPRQAPVPGAQRGKAPEGVEHGVVPRARGPYEIQSGEHALPEELLVGESLDAEPFDEDGGFLVRRRIEKVGSEERGVRAATGRERQRRGYQVQQGRIAARRSFPRLFSRRVVVVVVASCAFGKRFVYSQRRERRDALGVGRVKVRSRPRAPSEPPASQHETPQVRRLLPRERRGPGFRV